MLFSARRYMVLGEQLTPHLAVLSTSQLKLVTIYINRTAKARADRAASPPLPSHPLPLAQ